MAPDRNSENQTAPSDERNPFIAFRRHVDAQLSSLFGSVFSLPSNIYSQGQDHGRMWMQHRHDRLRQMDEEEKEAARGGEKDWEEAMKSFEDSEKEVKEWYDKVLRQITQRRDEHLESGMGFGNMERGMQAEVDTDRSDEHRAKERSEDEKNRKHSCGHPGRWQCERDYPQSRFLDWVWTGWGGPSTTPNMLWHRGHKEDDRSRTEAASTDDGERKIGPTLSLDDPRVQQAMAKGECPALADEATELPASAGRLPTLMFLLFDKASPLQLEKDPDVGIYGTLWRDAYEDLVRAQANEPLMTDEESAESGDIRPHEWLRRVLVAQKASPDEERVMEHGPLEAVKQIMFGGDEEFGRSWDRLRSQILRDAFSESDRLVTRNAGMQPEYSQARTSDNQGLDKNVDASDIPDSELALFMKQTFEDTTGTPADLAKGTVHGKPISTQRSSSQQDNSDGTRTFRQTTVDTFEGGQQRTVEQVSCWDPDGAMLSNVSKTNFTSSPVRDEGKLPQGWGRSTTSDGLSFYKDHETPSHHPSPALSTPASGSSEEDLPAGWERKVGRGGRPYYVDHNTRSTTWRHPAEGFVLPKNRNEFERLVNQRFKEAHGQHHNDPVTDDRKGTWSGWFWRS